MKIAFTSCMDTVNDDEQTGWNHLHAKQPDHIVLLGDSIYMDYGWGFGHHGNGEPATLTPAEFSTRMHKRYAAQWNLASFKQAIRNRQVHAIWDDHDFAWDNSRGAGKNRGNRNEFVPPEMVRLSREHFEVWRTALKSPDGVYPDNAWPDGDVPEGLNPPSIACTIPLDPGLVLHLTDGRTFREQKRGKLLGDEQRHALGLAFDHAPEALHIVASGSVLEEWAKYAEHPWLIERSQSLDMLVLSGDVHEARFGQPPGSRIFEATASAMAQKAAFGEAKRHGVFGILHIDTDVLHIELFEYGTLLQEHRIDRRTWTLQA